MNHLLTKTKNRLQLNKQSIAKLTLSQNQLLRIAGGKRAQLFSSVGGDPRCTSISNSSQNDCLAMNTEAVLFAI